MKRREFGQYCGLARALELVGERWALLIVRDLAVHPRRYTDLLEGLPGIPTNVLSTRLKELEQAGLVERRIAPAPQRGVVYALTADGGQLEAGIGPAPVPPDLVITFSTDDLPSFQALMQAANRGLVQLTGRRDLLDTFTRVFALRPAVTQPA